MTVRVTARVAMWAIVLCLMVAFAAEPTTSTQLDVQEGRGVAVVHAGGASLSRDVVSDVGDASRAVPQVASLAGLTIMLAALASRALSSHEMGCGSLRPRTAIAALSRRGPPAAP
jgi:hypothetical protein